MLISFTPQSKGCDFTITDPAGKPLFRMILPETLYQNRTEPIDHVIHTFPGHQVVGKQAAFCVIESPSSLLYESDLSEIDEHTLKMSVSVCNRSSRTFCDLRLDICFSRQCLHAHHARFAGSAAGRLLHDHRPMRPVPWQPGAAG